MVVMDGTPEDDKLRFASEDDDDFDQRMVNRRILEDDPEAKSGWENQRRQRVNHGVLERAVGKSLVDGGRVPGAPRMVGASGKAQKSSWTKPGRGNKVTDLQDGRSVEEFPSPEENKIWKRTRPRQRENPLGEAYNCSNEDCPDGRMSSKTTQLLLRSV